ncbi:probable basic-leucine zipper transcription factor R [Bactrocera dorsalis]|uniref:Probable basic-leucine zipper transcription factor R n=1 Tax=Bactrocera dorsalis TaxID=27457 RepID=A0ABM3JHJ2_BACDO|nr:probable basic-leucine zipper transcription factor R [Bactrocera dorsalis]
MLPPAANSPYLRNTSNSSANSNHSNHSNSNSPALQKPTCSGMRNAYNNNNNSGVVGGGAVSPHPVARHGKYASYLQQQQQQRALLQQQQLQQQQQQQQQENYLNAVNCSLYGAGSTGGAHATQPTQHAYSHVTAGAAVSANAASTSHLQHHALPHTNLSISGMSHAHSAGNAIISK